MNYLEKFSLLSENQYGFRKKKNCIQAATSLYKKIEENWQSKAKTNCIFVDFRKAFDSVDHKILLEKLTIMVLEGFLISSWKIIWQIDFSMLKLKMNVQKWDR